MKNKVLPLLILCSCLPVFGGVRSDVPPLPQNARLALDESWNTGLIDTNRWYALRKQWGAGNHGVVPENIEILKDEVFGTTRNVLVCHARGDRYKGPIRGQWGKTTRTGGVIVSKQHFASGRFEVVMKIGTENDAEGGPANPAHPKGAIPAIWTYGYRHEKISPDRSDEFARDQPLYHPYLQQWAKGHAFYWSELDFPEFGKAGKFDRPMYNTFLNKQHDTLEFDLPYAADGRYHTYTTEWRTGLVPHPGIQDHQMAEHAGFWWVRDASIPWNSYWGAAFKRIGPDNFHRCVGLIARHWCDGKPVGENTHLVPAMSAQLNVGVWLPDWAGPAPWSSSRVSFASIRVWQYNDPGDVFGILVDDITDSFDANGAPFK